MKKIITLFICLAMIVSMGSIVFAEDPEPGAFSQIDLYEEVHMAIEETEPTGIYYVPAQIENEAYFYVGATAQPDAVPDAADAPVFILYADYENQEEALESITSTGLKDLADKVGAFVVTLKRSGEDWGKDDVTVYNGIMLWLETHNAASPFGTYAYNARTFVIAEGDAATFVNHYLAGTQYKLAGVLSIGGDIGFAPEETEESAEEGDSGSSGGSSAMDPISTDYPLLAYLVNTTDAAVGHYRAINGADAEKQVGDTTVYYNSETPLLQVAIGEGETIADVLDDFWYTIGSRASREALTYKAYVEHYNTDERYYCELVNYDDLGVTLIDHYNDVLEGTKALTDWAVYVPNEVAEGNSGDKKYPLIIACHGAGDEMHYEAESQGWVSLIPEKDVIVASMEHNVETEDRGQDINTLTRYLIDNYPVDASRIYIVGFSMGGGVVSDAVANDPELYAAFGIMHSRFNADMAGYEGRLAGIFALGGNDTKSFEEGQQTMVNTVAGLAGFTIPFEEDTSSANFYGLGHDGTVSIPSHGMTYTYKEFAAEDGIPYVAVSCLENADHVHFIGNAAVMYDYMSRFSRGEDGALIYTAE